MKKIQIVMIMTLFYLMIMMPYSYGKYTMEDTKKVADISIDTVAPRIQCALITNSNLGYESYANKTHNIMIRINVIEKNIKENFFDKEHIKILVAENETVPQDYTIREILQTSKMTVYEINLSKIEGNGLLKIKVPKATIKDIANNINEETIIETGITIDNIAPVTQFVQKETQQGKVEAQIDINEPIRNLNGWNLSQESQKLTKEFSSNVSYPLPVVDFAENKTEVDINITKATNIILEYGSYGKNRIWECGQGNNEIVGKKNINQNLNYKTEIITLYTAGNIDKDFVQIQTYINTYWGEGKKGLNNYEIIYSHGYNPSKSEYDSLSTPGKLAYVEDKIRLVIGGNDINSAGEKGISGNPIPKELASQNLYGISALNMKLKDSSENSIVYQIWVNGQGWLAPASDGIETTYSHDKPFGAYRISIIPKTEKQYLISAWSKDIGSNNMK